MLDPTYAADLPYYRIWREPGPGFFSIVSGVLGHLRIAEELGLEPIVDMESSPGTYTEDQPVFGTQNMWNYYFVPIGPQETQFLHAESVVDCGGGFPFGVLTFPFADTPWLLPTWDRYVRLRAEVAEEVDGARKQIEPASDVLAVHYRGKEMRNALHHPMPPTQSQIFRRVEGQLESGYFKRIFLVSEGEEYIRDFEKRYGSLVTTLPVARSGISNVYLEYPRPMHKFRLGLEILTEVLIMSECGGMVCGYTNVSQMAEVLARGRMHSIDRVWNGKLRGGRFAARFLWDYRSKVPPALGGFRA